MTASNTVAYKIGLGAGKYFDGGNRNVSNGSASVTYTLCHDAACTREWGERGMTGGSFLSAEPTAEIRGNGASQAFSVYAAMRKAPSDEGRYSDIVRILVEW